MKTIDTNEKLNLEPTLADRCVESCKNYWLASMRPRNRIANEFHENARSERVSWFNWR